MALRSEYEAVRASLLHRNPLPSLDTAIQEIIFEETRLSLDKTPQFETVLATTRSSHQKSGNQLCKNCNQIGHTFAYCPTIECRYCHGYGHILEHCPTRPPRTKGGHSKFKNVSKPGSSSVTAVAATEGSTVITMSDLKALFKQVQDPQKGQILGEGRRVGQLFELASLHLPQRFVFAATIPNSSIHQWHLHLGYASADNAVEYRDSYLLQFLSQQGTVVQHSCPHTSQQNGRAEREHHHIFDSVRTFLLFASCLEKFWGEVALHAVYIINRLPILVLHNLSPFKKLFGQSPDYSILKPFGCVSFVLLQPHEHTKLEPRARLCCFLGYDIEHKGYRC
ncbi:uncharacterized protein LOC110640683 isoform X3 [Hevea brasiliensis]|uniref:uncharacterized protein LOC110640683 isoform X3 n=1 Tax=Hevea brasiliensis TaxID=3981 RepID=UPI0025E39FD4|nr:uncharacterized protein LOC110640683 isoform X3 [Hevea brasiliensis]